MGFVIGAAILVVLVLGTLAFPWWRRRSGETPPPLSGEHLAAELNDDVATGLLAEEDLKPAARDLEASAAGDSGVQAPERQRWSWRTAGLLLVPLAAVVLYIHFGDWRAALQGEKAASAHQLEMSLAQLQTHLGAHPRDIQGWLNLGQGDEALGRYQDAARAFGRAAGLQTQPDPDVLGLWGEALILANPQQVTPEEQRIFALVLKLDPDNERGLWYGGLIALSSGNRAEVLKDWRRLLTHTDVPPQVADVVRSHLAMLGTNAGTAAAASVAGEAAPQRPQLSIRVSLEPGLAKQFTPGETLFVFVRTLQGGPPLAVRKVEVQAFPVTVVLDDADAMLAGRDLSSAAGPVDIVARLSRSGTADARPGDLEGVRTVNMKHGAQKLDIALDQIVGSATAGTSATPSPGS